MRLVVGQVVRPHGIRGEVVVEVTTDEPGDRFAAGSVLRTDPAGSPGAGVAGPEGQQTSDGGQVSGGLPVRAPRTPVVPRVLDALRVEAVRPHQGRLIIAFEGVLDRNAAEALRGVRLWVDSADVPEPEDPDEFHDFQLVGLRAVDAAGQPLGEVIRVEHGPAADLLVVRLLTPAGRDVLVPFVRAIVPTVDVAGGHLVLTPPEGLFDL